MRKQPLDWPAIVVGNAVALLSFVLVAAGGVLGVVGVALFATVGTWVVWRTAPQGRTRRLWLAFLGVGVVALLVVLGVGSGVIDPLQVGS